MKNTDEALEEDLMMMVAHGGNANAKVYEALDLYSEGKKEDSRCLLEEAEQELMTAHHHQFSLLSQESEGAALVPWYWGVWRWECSAAVSPKRWAGWCWRVLGPDFRWITCNILENVEDAPPLARGPRPLGGGADGQ